MLTADYYDGKTSRRQQVVLQFLADRILVSGEGVERDDALSTTRISERLGQASRIIRFADGAHCEVRDIGELEALLAVAGYRDGHVDRLQRSWGIVAVSAVLLVVAAVSAYLWGLPWVAKRIAERIPAAIVHRISESTREVLEDRVLKPSKLSLERQKELQAGLDAMRGPDGESQPPHRLYFFSSPQLGANAISLPDGSILLLDELVNLADSDQQIYGVIGHELGHLHYRHGLRLAVEGSAVGGVTAWWFGDFSSLLVLGPALLLQTRYSREFETQADEYAKLFMRANQIPPRRLAEMLSKLSDARSPKAGGKASTAELSKPDMPDYLSSHPATAERIRALNVD